MGITLLIGLIGYGYLYYRQKQSYQQYIPGKTSALFRINVDGMLCSIIGNAVLNPSYYFRSEKEANERNSALKNMGIRIPANIFFFSVEPYEETFFSVFKISNLNEFKQYIKGTFKATIATTDSVVFKGASADGRLCFMFTKEQVALSVSASKTKPFHILNNLIQKHDLISVENSPFYPAIKAEDELVYVSKGTIVKAKFEKGAFSLKGDIRTVLIKGVGSLYPKQFESNSLIKFWLAADINSLLSQQKTLVEKYSVPVDTLLRYYGSYMDLEWKRALIAQEDTVITYDYNDNFEKVERKTIRKERVPEIYLSLQASPHLINYLPKQFFYKFSAKSRSGRLFIGTGLNNSLEHMNNLSKNFFYLFVDFQGLRNQAKYPLLQKYLRNADIMEIQGRKLGRGEIRIEGTLFFENKAINGLVQLLRNNSK